MTSSGVLLYHCTKNEAEFAEVVSILGNSRKFKIGHLRLDVKLGRTEGLTIEEMAKKKGWLLLVVEEERKFFKQLKSKQRAGCSIACRFQFARRLCTFKLAMCFSQESSLTKSELPSLWKGEIKKFFFFFF